MSQGSESRGTIDRGLGPAKVPTRSQTPPRWTQNSQCQKMPSSREKLKWRDSDSNRGHRNFQWLGKHPEPPCEP
jgi:hypothetical protein